MKARVSLNLPQSLKAAAEEFAGRDGVSVNQYIALALAEKVGAGGGGVICRAGEGWRMQSGRCGGWRGGWSEGWGAGADLWMPKLNSDFVE